MPITKSVAELRTEADAQITTYSAEEAIEMAKSEDVVLVDIRDVRELQRDGQVPGAVHAPRGMLEFWVDPDSPYFKDVFGQDDKKYVFHCASGWRSALTVATLQDMGFDAAHLKEGFSTWAEKGGPVEKVEKP